MKYPGGAGTYHKISNPKEFIKKMQNMYDAFFISFYIGKKYKGYWNKQKGLIM